MPWSPSTHDRPANAKSRPPGGERLTLRLTDSSRAYRDTLKSMGCAIHTPTALSRFIAGENSICSTI